ncbi:MAG: histidine phosphatase family protein [Thaumarchaeota archaeon]|nr:histidine phosphatase family protein [Nitrososphaerota archaeon]
MSLIIFLRHAQAKNNVDRILAGRREGIPLTKKGIEQANKIATFLEPLKISAIYSSPIERALHTAKIIADKLDASYQIDERITEIEMGTFSGMNYEDMFEKYGNVFLRFYQNDPVIEKNGVETFSNVKKRVLEMVNHCSAVHEDKNVLLVTHMDPIKAIISTITQLRPESLYELIIRNASLTIVKKEQADFSLVSMNSMSSERYIQE